MRKRFLSSFITLSLMLTGFSSAAYADIELPFVPIEEMNKNHPPAVSAPAESAGRIITQSSESAVQEISSEYNDDTLPASVKIQESSRSTDTSCSTAGIPETSQTYTVTSVSVTDFITETDCTGQETVFSDYTDVLPVSAQENDNNNKRGFPVPAAVSAFLILFGTGIVILIKKMKK